MKILKRFFTPMEPQNKCQMKKFRQVYDIFSHCLAEGNESMSIGSLYCEIGRSTCEEDEISISIKRNNAILVRDKGVMVRRRLFDEDEVEFYADEKNGFRVYVWKKDEGRTYWCKDRRRSAELDGLIKKLYESYATEKISEKRFELLSGEYEREQEALEAAIEQGQTELDAYESDTDRVDQFLALVKKYTDFSVLTTPMIYEFVDKILVHAPDRSTGDRTQEVDIYLKFIGKLDVPLPEPTPEELAEQEKLRKQRAYYRERSKRERERRKQKKLLESGKSA